MEESMFIVHVSVHVKSGFIQEFINATKVNAENSIKEPGIVRFDVLQSKEEPRSFLLVEVYKTEIDPGKHKETIHYKIWRDAVEKMMEEPRQSVRYLNCFPEDADWK
jgi:autoinducer 2-degrading protein